MRALGFGLVLLGTVLGLSFGCGESTGDTASAGGGSSGAATAGSSGSAGTAAGKAGSGASSTAGTAGGGSAAGGNANSGGVSGVAATTGGQDDTQAGASNDAGSGSTLVDCDPKKVLCKRLAPECAVGEVPSVDGNCYGDCVKIDRCACSAAAQCPEPGQYTCWAKQHCGPFVQ